MQSTSWEKLDWKKHKLESRLPGEISITQICRWHHPFGRKWRGAKKPLGESERREWKSWLKLNIQKTNIMASGPITSWEIYGETVETVLVPFSSVQLLSRVLLFATLWIAALQASLSIRNSWSSFRLTYIESVMPSSHLIFYRPLLLLTPIPPSIRVVSNELTLRLRWPKYWSFSFSIIPSKEIPGLISCRNRSDFTFLGSKIIADGDCSLLGRKVMTNLDSIFKSRDITLPTKVSLVKAMVFPVVMYGCES